MSHQLRVAIVGSGMIARVHSQVVTSHPDMMVEAIIGPSPDRNLKLADYTEEISGSRPSIFPTLNLALRDAHLDVVVVAAPSGSHFELAKEAIEADKHVVIEKPLDTCLVRARTLQTLARQARANGKVVSVISQHRLDPANVLVKEAIIAGRLGHVTSASATVAWWRSQKYYDSGGWRGTWEFDGGGALMNQGIHTVDLLTYFFGKPLEVFGDTGRLAHRDIEVEDVGAAVIRFESGLIATLLATTSAYPHVGTRIQVHGTAGSAILDDDKLRFFYSTENPEESLEAPAFENRAMAEVPAEEVAPAVFEGEPPLFDGHMRQYDDIVAAIRTGEEPAVSVDDAIVAQALVRSIYVSNVLRRSVAYGDVLAGQYDDVPSQTQGWPQAVEPDQSSGLANRAGIHVSAGSVHGR